MSTARRPTVCGMGTSVEDGCRESSRERRRPPAAAPRSRALDGEPRTWCTSSELVELAWGHSDLAKGRTEARAAASHGLATLLDPPHVNHRPSSHASRRRSRSSAVTLRFLARLFLYLCRPLEVAMVARRCRRSNRPSCGSVGSDGLGHAAIAVEDTGDRLLPEIPAELQAAVGEDGHVDDGEARAGGGGTGGRRDGGRVIAGKDGPRVPGEAPRRGRVAPSDSSARAAARSWGRPPWPPAPPTRLSSRRRAGGRRSRR